MLALNITIIVVTPLKAHFMYRINSNLFIKYQVFVIRFKEHTVIEQ